LRHEGRVINRKRVQRHMREMGISGITPGPNLSRRAQGHRLFPYLLRDLVIARPDQVWGIDITYIRLVGGWLYLVAIIDWFSRYILSWELDETLEMPFVMECVERALSQPQARDLEQRSRLALHFAALHRPPPTGRGPDQYGRQGARAGQHSDRTLLQDAQV
jgi:putative transposase